jgi:hypothetical protein
VGRPVQSRLGAALMTVLIQFTHTDDELSALERELLGEGLRLSFGQVFPSGNLGVHYSPSCWWTVGDTSKAIRFYSDRTVRVQTDLHRCPSLLCLQPTLDPAITGAENVTHGESNPDIECMETLAGERFREVLPSVATVTTTSSGVADTFWRNIFAMSRAAGDISSTNPGNSLDFCSVLTGCTSFFSRV